MISEGKKEQYIAQQAVRCLYCGSYEIESGDMNWDMPLTLQVSCLVCNRTWKDVLGVIGVIEDDDDTSGLYSVRRFAVYDPALREMASPKVYNTYEAASLDPACNTSGRFVIPVTVYLREE